MVLDVKRWLVLTSFGGINELNPFVFKVSSTCQPSYQDCIKVSLDINLLDTFMCTTLDTTIKPLSAPQVKWIMIIIMFHVDVTLTCIIRRSRNAPNGEDPPPPKSYNVPCWTTTYNSRITQESLEKRLTIWTWPPNSPDPNITNDLWSVFRCRSMSWQLRAVCQGPLQYHLAGFNVVVCVCEFYVTYLILK